MAGRIQKRARRTQTEEQLPSGAIRQRIVHADQTATRLTHVGKRERGRREFVIRIVVFDDAGAFDAKEYEW